MPLLKKIGEFSHGASANTIDAIAGKVDWFVTIPQEGGKLKEILHVWKKKNIRMHEDFLLKWSNLFSSAKVRLNKQSVLNFMQRNILMSGLQQDYK